MASLKGTKKTEAEMKAICKDQGISESNWMAAAQALSITIIDGEVETTETPEGMTTKDMSDAQVIAQANADREDGYGAYGMTAAMREEQRRMSCRGIKNVYDE